MKKLLGTVFLILLCCSTLYADDRYKPWVYNDVKISEKCLKHLYPLASGDWYESYYDTYIENDCVSAVLIKHYSESRVKLFGMTVYGLYDLEGKLTILPLRNLK